MFQEINLIIVKIITNNKIIKLLRKQLVVTKLMVFYHNSHLFCN